MEAVLDETADGGPDDIRADDIGGLYLTFNLGAEEYGLEILKIRELICMMVTTQVPQTEDFVIGVINLRGKVIPVVDLRLKFGLPPREYDEETCIIVVDVGTLMGIVVDTVCEVHEIPAEAIEPPPEFGVGVGNGHILGMGKVQGKVKILLDIEEVLTSGELVVTEADAST